MRPAAVIFDVYQTIIQIIPPPLDVEARWEQLCRLHLGHPPSLSLAELDGHCQATVARHHAAAQKTGVQCPEVYWPDIVPEVLPDLKSLPGPQQEDFLYQHIQLLRSIRLMPGAAAVLRQLACQDLLLGIASNAQPYTHREFQSLLAAENLRTDMFQPDLCFWSWQQGFSKPNPHVFRILTAKLRARGLHPNQALMVGDRLDNDLWPARSQGWPTWQIREDPTLTEEPGGDWPALARFLQLP